MITLNAQTIFADSLYFFGFLTVMAVVSAVVWIIIFTWVKW